MYDVIVADERSGRGWETVSVRVLLEHPVVCGVGRVLLSTLDAQGYFMNALDFERVLCLQTRGCPR